MNNKSAKLISMTTATVLIALILASSLYYSGGNITANVVAEDSSGFIAPPIREVNFNELRQLNEGWYEIRNGYLFYMETFDSFIPMYIKVRNPSGLNGLLAVDAYGNIEFFEKEQSNEIQSYEEESQNLITGEVTGLEAVSGMQGASDENIFYLRLQSTLTYGQLQPKDKLINDQGSVVATITRVTPLPNNKVKIEVIKSDGTPDFGQYDFNSPVGNAAWFRAMTPVQPLQQPPPAPSTALPSGEIKSYQSLGDAAGDHLRESLIGKEIQIRNPSGGYDTYRVGATSDSRNLVFFKGNEGYGRTSDGKLAYRDRDGFVQVTSTSYSGWTPPASGACAGGICNQNGQFISSQEFEQVRARIQQERANIFYAVVKNERGETVYERIEGAANRQEAQRLAVNTYGQTVPVINENERQRQLSQPATPETLTEGRKAWLYQLEKDGRLETIVIHLPKDATPEQARQVAANNAVKIQGGRLVGTPEPQKFTVVFDGFSDLLWTVEANSQADAVAAARSRFSAAFQNQVDASKLNPKEVTQLRIGAQAIAEAGQYQTKTSTVNGKKVTMVIAPDGTPVQSFIGDTQETQANNLRIQLQTRLDQERYSRLAQENSRLKGYTITNERDQGGLPIVSDSQGKKYQFNRQSGEYAPVTGDSYIAYEQIGENAFVLKKLSNDKQNRLIESTLQINGQPVPIDDTGLKIIRSALSRGLVPRIAGGVATDTSIPREEVTDREGNRWKKGACGIPDSYCRVDAAGTPISPTPTAVSWNDLKLWLDEGQLAQGVIEFRNKDTNAVEARITGVGGASLQKGSYTYEQFRQVHVDKNGRVISEQEANLLRQQGERVNTRYETASLQDFLDGTLVKTTFLKYMTVKRGGEYVRTFESRPINEKTGKREGYIYGEIDKSGNEIMIRLVEGREEVYQNGQFVSISQLSPEQRKILDRGKTQNSQYKWRSFIANFERILTEYRGLNYYASLFFDEDELLKWRADVEKFFDKNNLGVEYWISDICRENIEGINEGVAYAETPQGLAQIGAHIEATRTQPLLNLSDNAISYIYKITLNVRNGDYKQDLRAPENMTLNAIIVNEGASLESLGNNDFVPIFKHNVHLGRGESFGRLGSNAIVKESKKQYGAVCLIFKDIPIKWNLGKNSKISITWETEEGRKYAGTWWTLCNTMKVSSGEPTTLPAAPVAVPRGSNADLNDF